jgi:hypothetical protein
LGHQKENTMFGKSIVSLLMTAFAAFQKDPIGFTPRTFAQNIGRGSRAPGPRRPAGSKLARKAANGTVGKAVLK